MKTERSRGRRARPLHDWVTDPAEARGIQRSLAARVELTGSAAGAATVCGLDVAYDAHTDRLAAAAVVLSVETLERIEEASIVTQATFDYIAGLFSFREMPALLEVLAELDEQPDLLVCDGQGYAHPERFGLACHLGLWTGCPTIGCAKQPLIGAFEMLDDERGSRQPLVDDGELVGYALRTRVGVKPVFVSPGHKIGFDESCSWILRLGAGFRLPETTRAADRLAATALAKANPC